jgi:hypothetical protein
MKMKLFAAAMLTAGFAWLVMPTSAAPTGPVTTGVEKLSPAQNAHYRRYRHRHCYWHRHYKGGKKHRHCRYHRRGGIGIGIYIGI